MRLIDADACPALFDAEFKKTRRLILYGEKHLDNLAEGFMEANNVIRSMPTITPPPNDPLTPLTLEELREMHFEPVWISFYVPYGEDIGVWALVCVDEYTGELFLTNARGERYLYEEVIVDIEAIYRRKPEEGA